MILPKPGAGAPEKPRHNASVRPRCGHRTVCAAVSHTDVTRRLKLEIEARRHRVIGCLVEDGTAKPAGAIDGITPDVLSDRCAAEWSQWAVAKAKLSLFSSEAALEKPGVGGPASRRVAASAIARLRRHAVPPILVGNPGRLVGSWCLMAPTRATRFGDCDLSELSCGLDAVYDRSPTHVDVQFVVRMFEADGLYSESAFFADLATARRGSFTEFGRFGIAGANTVRLTPTRLSLAIERDETELEGLKAAPRTLSIGYLDNDLLLEGGHDTADGSVLGWGRDHAIDLQEDLRSSRDD